MSGVSEWVSEWVSVSEGAGGGGRREADTELKTKTPHVNVGKKKETPYLQAWPLFAFHAHDM